MLRAPIFSSLEIAGDMLSGLDSDIMALIVVTFHFSSSWLALSVCVQSKSLSDKRADTVAATRDEMLRSVLSKNLSICRRAQVTVDVISSTKNKLIQVFVVVNSEWVTLVIKSTTFRRRHITRTCGLTKWSSRLVGRQFACVFSS